MKRRAARSDLRCDRGRAGFRSEEALPDQDVLARVTIDHKDGTYETYRRWEVVADDVVMESPDRQVRLMDAIDEADGVDVGDYIEEQIETQTSVVSPRRLPSR